MDIAPAAQKIAEYLDSQREEILELLRVLVEIESPTEYRKGVNEVGDVLARELSEVGFSVRSLSQDNFGDHLLGEFNVHEGPRALLVGHMDTVHPLGTGWGFSIDDGRAYGPGVIDMKSGDVVLVYALKALRETTGLPCSMRVLFNSDEEPGSPSSRHLFAELVEGVDWSFVLEPSGPDGDVVVERKGVGIFTIKVTGRASHAGQEPEKGIDANLELASLIIQAASLADDSVGTTINPGKIAGGTLPYVVAESASVEIDVRVTSAKEQERIENEMAALTATNRVEGTSIEVSGGFHRPPMVSLDKDSELIAAVSSAAAQYGQYLQHGGSGGASDGNNLAALGIPTIDGMGPIGGNAHSRGEYMEVESLFDRAALLAMSLLVLGERKEHHVGG